MSRYRKYTKGTQSTHLSEVRSKNFYTDEVRTSTRFATAAKTAPFDEESIDKFWVSQQGFTAHKNFLSMAVEANEH